MLVERKWQLQQLALQASRVVKEGAVRTLEGRDGAAYRMKSTFWAVLAALLLATGAAEDFRVIDPPEDGPQKPSPSLPLDRNVPITQHKPKARAGVLVARYIPQDKLPPDTILGFANITYR